MPALPLNRDMADRAVLAFNLLRLADVPGTPHLADAGADWFREIVAAIFGSVDPVTRQRAIRELFLLVPKKNAKTTYGALMMLVALLFNQRPNALMIMTAPVQDVARLAFDSVAGAIELDPVLRAKLHVRDHIKTIVHRETKAELQIMTFDPSVLTGQKIVAGLIDELHVVAKMGKAPSALRQIRGGMLPYPEAFLAFITTQSEEAPAGVFKSELDAARAIRDGKQTGAMLPILYELPYSMQKDPALWRDPANWSMVTPNEGKSIAIDRLAEDMISAERKGEAEIRAWASQHLNVEIGVALRSDSWVGGDMWESCAVPVYSLEEFLDRCEVVTAGIDGGGLDDMLGFALLGREKAAGKWLVWCRAWLHPIALERQKKESQRFLDFERAGELTIVKVAGEDVTELCDILEKIEKAALLERIGVDPAGVSGIVDELLNRGFAQDRIVGISQGWRLSGAIKTVERKLAERALVHDNGPLMKWCVGNAKVEPRGNAQLITKLASGSGKIDPLMALFSASSLMALNPAPKKRKLVMFTTGNKN